MLEVIALSLEDALAAQRGGAGRLEVVRELDREGLTPAYDLVAAIAGLVAIPIRVMLREREPFDGHREADLDALATAAERFALLRVEGFVMGFLREGQVDTAAIGRVLGRTAASRVTFHRAIERARDEREALRALTAEPRVDRVLVTGGAGHWTERAGRLAALVKAAPPAITPVAAGGVDVAAIAMLRSATALAEFHVGRAARVDGRLDGPVSASRVAALARAARTAP